VTAGSRGGADGCAAPPEAVLARGIAAGLGGALPGAVGVALSGGGDSVALLLMMADWAAARGLRLEAATVDHRLRPEAAVEAADCAALCTRLGLRHEILVWERSCEGLPDGNLQQAAREARRGLLAAWARRRGLDAVALGHTRDDQAETVLLRLARGSGVDGLAAMAPALRAEGVLWLRPLLELPRAALRQVCQARGVGWAEDPGNADARFARVRARGIAEELERIGGPGLAPEGLARLARHMAAARVVLEAAADQAVRSLLRIEGADVVIEAAGLFALPSDTRDRLVARIIARLGARAGLRPRHDALTRLIAGLERGRGGTLGGCRLLREGTAIRALREPRAAAAALHVPVGQDWDARWRIEPQPGTTPDTTGLETRALGAAGLAACPDVPRGCQARASLAAGPALWRGGVLVAAPLAGLGPQWRAISLISAGDFVAGPIAH
jgi:tRNA(Ile)-lysidine synthase